MHVNPYLYFNGRCEEAIEFYRHSIGAKIETLARFKDHPGTPMPNGAEQKIMHADLRIGDTRVSASDGQCSGTTTFQGFSLSLTANSDSEAGHLFTALSDGGHVQLPITETPFASRFGMVVDRFGVLWTVVSVHEKNVSAPR